MTGIIVLTFRLLSESQYFLKIDLEILIIYIYNLPRDVKDYILFYIAIILFYLEVSYVIW